MANSNAPAISVPATAARQLSTLIKYADRLPDVMEKSKALQPSISVFALLESFAEQIGIPYRDLDNIVYALENLRVGVEQFGSLDDAIDRLAAAVDEPLSSDLRRRKDDISRIVSAYRSDNPIATTFKAQKLAYLHEKILRDAEIITDMRPVFDGGGKQILEVLVSHTLVLTTAGPGRTERVHLAMDAADVMSLRSACDRAIDKAKAIQSALEGSDIKWRVQILRGGQDGI